METDKRYGLARETLVAASSPPGVLSRRAVIGAGLVGMAAAHPLLSACAGAGGSAGSLTFLADTRDEWGRLEAMKEQLKDEYGLSFSMQHLQETPLRAKTGLELTAPSTSIDVLLLDFLLLPQFASSGSLHPLDDDLAEVATFNADDFRTPFVEALSLDDALYGLPITQDCNILMYRADVFDELGLDTPKTMDEFADTAREITRWGKSDGIYGVAMRGQRGVGISEWTWPCFLHSFGGSYYRKFPDDLTPALASDEAIDALEFYVKLLAEAGPQGASSYGPVEVLNDVSQGKAAMVLDSATLAMSAEDPETSKVAGKLAYETVPEGPAGRFPGFYTWALAVPNGSAQRKEAATFIGWALSPDVAIEAGFSAPNQALSQTYTNEARGSYPQARGALEVLEESLDLADPDYRPRNGQAQEVGDIVSIAVSQAVSGQASPKEALKQANASVRVVLEKAGLL